MKSESEELKNKEVTREQVGQLVHLRVLTVKKDGKRIRRSIVGTVVKINEFTVFVLEPAEPQVITPERKPRMFAIQKELIESVVPEGDLGTIKAQALLGKLHLHLLTRPGYVAKDGRVIEPTRAHFSRCYNGQFKLIIFEYPLRTLFNRKGEELLAEAEAGGFEIIGWGEEAPD